MTIFDFWDLYDKRSFPSTTFNSSLATNSLVSSPAYFNAPGFTSSDVKAEIKHNDILYITGESEKYGKKRISFGVHIPEKVDQRSIELKVENGMIAVTFEHKREESKVIKVK